MDIVKTGDSSWNMKVTCQGYYSSDYPCFSELIVSKEDIVRLVNGMKDIYGFICPVCNQFTQINRDSLPYSVKANSIGIAEKDSEFYDFLSAKGQKMSEKVIIHRSSKK